MERFHEVRVNFKHSSVSQEDDLVKLAYYLRFEIKYRCNRRIFPAEQARDLFTEDGKGLSIGVQKFNRKWKNIEDSMNTTEIENEINCDLTEIYSDEHLDQ